MAMNLPCVENSDRLIASTCTQISSLVSNLSVFFIYFKYVPLFICLFLVEVALGIIRKKKNHNFSFSMGKMSSARNLFTVQLTEFLYFISSFNDQFSFYDVE